MPRGGKRNGSGRKNGAATRKTREVADRAAAAGLSPLDVMLKAMVKFVEAENWPAAAKIASDAAPYMHPRLSSTTIQATIGKQKEIVEVLKRAEPDGNGEADR